jgi:hypothetical protein
MFDISRNLCNTNAGITGRVGLESYKLGECIPGEKMLGRANGGERLHIYVTNHNDRKTPE